MTVSAGLPLSRAFPSSLFPLDRLDPGGDVTELLSRILITSYEEQLFGDDGGGFTLGLSIAEELTINLVGLEGFSLVFGGASATTLILGAELRREEIKVRLGTGVRLRFPRSILKPVQKEGDLWVDDPTRPFAEISITSEIVIDHNWNVTFGTGNEFTLSPSMIADSGFVLEGDIALDLSETTGLEESQAIGLPLTWRGVVFRSLTVHLPDAIREAVPIAGVAFEDFHIGSGGVSGTIRLEGAPGSGSIAGFPFAPTAFAVELMQNALTGAELSGTLQVPFFDAPLAVTVGFDLAGNFTVRLAADGGLVELRKEGLLSLSLENVAFEKEDGLFLVSLGGTIQLEAGGLDWPAVAVDRLSIASDGSVRIEGGWLDLREQYVLAFYGFQFSISRIGFGTETDGTRWIGVNGGLKLVEGLTAGASVEGLRVRWSPGDQPNPTLSLEGVGVELAIPGVFSFKGFVAMRQPEPGVFRFDGSIELNLMAMGLTIDGQLVIGYNQPLDFTFFAIYIGVELPVGIPLWTTGLGLYGMAGLLAINMEPGRAPDEEWYSVPPSRSWYHRDPPGVGVAELRKWDAVKGSFGLGAGITIGTVYDNGFTFAGRMLLAIVFPGPIILIEGRANVLKPRASLGDEPVFRTLLVIDGREATLTAGIDAHYAIADAGELIDMRGSLEAFFDFMDPAAWHLYLGVKEPRERRVGSDLFFSIFRSESYFMLDAHRAQMGAWTGVEEHWSFGPVSVDLEAWVEARAELSFKPTYLRGGLTLHGGFGVSLFGFGFRMGTEATIDAWVFDPFLLRADFDLSINMPWPEADREVSFSLKWGPEREPPLLPVPVKEVSIGHERVDVTWALDAGAPRGDFFDGQPLAPQRLDKPPPEGLPVVPLDARPEITFGRSVHDDARIGVNAQPQYMSVAPYGKTVIGDPSSKAGSALMRPALKEVRLERWSGSEWQPLASADNAVTPLYGAWMPVPAEPGETEGTGQTKLRLWAKSPFSFTRRTGQEWDDWFASAYPNYPCITPPADRTVCCDFESLALSSRLEAPFTGAGDDVLLLTWSSPPAPIVEMRPFNGESRRGLCFAGGEVVVRLLQGVRRVSIKAAPGRPDEEADGDCVDFQNRRVGTGSNPRFEGGHGIEVFDVGGGRAQESEIRRIELVSGWHGTGLMCGLETRIALGEPTPAARLWVSTSDTPVQIAAFAGSGARVATGVVTGKSVMTLVDLVSSGGDIVSISILPHSAGTARLHRLCAAKVDDRKIYADCFDAGGAFLSRTFADKGVADVDARGAASVVVARDGAGFCLVSVCATVGLLPSDRLDLNQLSHHVVEEVARWESDGELLPPYSTFRLRIVTALDVELPPGPPQERPFGLPLSAPTPSLIAADLAREHRITQVAYFRTEGPPGLATLTQPGDALVSGEGADAPPSMATGLEDLSRYVAQTLPPTVPSYGPPVLPRPVYRGYDVGVSFNTPYVDQMYAMAGRDLVLALYDTNDEPVRDERGRVLVARNAWGRTPTLTLTESDRRWLEVLARGRCTSSVLDLGKVARNKTVGLGGHVLAPETVYEARLIPLLAHERFDGFAAGRGASGTGAVLAGSGPLSWSVLDVGGVGGPSRWRVGVAAGAPCVEQLTDVSLGPSSRNAPFPGGTLLALTGRSDVPADHPDQPSAWTDYRLSGFVRSSDDDVVGLGVRRSQKRGYLLTLDRQLGRMRLVLTGSGRGEVLAEKPGGYERNSDIDISIEVVGSRIRAHVDGVLVFDVTDERRPTGGVALYSADNAGARFTDIRVEDLRKTAPVAYRFKFTSSAFADFRHHLWSGDERVLSVPDANPAALEGAAAAAIGSASPEAGLAPTEAEARAYDAVAVSASGPSARQRTRTVELARVRSGSATKAVLVRTAEPIDWRRTRLSVDAATPSTPPLPAKTAKLAEVGFSAGAAPDPMDESATVLLLEERDMTGHAIERRTLPSPDAPDLAAGTSLFAGNFLEDQEIRERAPREVPTPAFDDLSGLRLVTPDGLGVPNWSASGGTLKQTGFFLSSPDVGARPGALALLTALVPADLRLMLRLEVPGSGAAGVVFRFRDAMNHYRFAINRDTRQRTLVRIVDGRLTTLHASALPTGGGDVQTLIVETIGSRLTVWVDGRRVVSVVDDGLAGGAVGFYSYGLSNARFSRVRLDRIGRVLGDWQVEDRSDAGAQGTWRIAYGVLAKDPALPAATGESFATVADGMSADLRVETVIAPTSAGEAGIVWRYRSPAHHVRLALAASGEARLVARRGGIDVVLWSGASPAAAAYAVSVEAVGHRILLDIDGVRMADIAEAGLGAGTIGAFADLGAGAQFNPFRIAHAAPIWEIWHVFGSEGGRASGRRLRVVAGAAPPDVRAPAGEATRWKDAAPTGFRPAFPREGVDLRLVDPTRQTLHQRRFRPDDAFTPLAVRMLRAADGTGFILLPVGPGSLPSGEIRATFEFHRDPQHPEAHRQSQEGETGTETARLTVT